MISFKINIYLMCESSLADDLSCIPLLSLDFLDLRSALQFAVTMKTCFLVRARSRMLECSRKDKSSGFMHTSR